MRLTLAGRIWTGFGTSAVALAAVTTLWLVYEHQMRGLDALDESTRHMVIDTAALTANVRDAESGVRGYIITGAVSYLESYQRAISYVPEIFKHLGSHVVEGTVQQERVDALEALVEIRLGQLARTVALRRAQGFDAARAFVLSNEDRRAMEQLRGITGELIAVQTELLEQGQAKIADMRRRATLAIAAGGAGILVTLFLAALTTFLSIRKRRDELVNAVARLAGGDLGYRVPVSDQDEFSALGNRFNEMAQAVQQGRQELLAANENLSRHAATLRMLGAMVQRLQASATLEEFGDTIRRFAPEVLAGRRGALLIGDASGALVSVAVQWGGPLATKAQFVPDECWALRRSQSHVFSPASTEVRCSHVDPGFADASACVPLMGHGTLAGLFYFEFETAPAAPLAGEALLDESVGAFCESVAISLANFRLRETQRMQSIRDPLTSLFNRRYLDETLALEFSRAQRSKSSLCVIMCDIDHFKDFNDKYGHDCGDLVLREIARLLAGHSRKGDVACRYGGEEFTLVMPGAVAAVARERSDALRRAIGALRLECAGKPLEPVTMSFGVACFPEYGETPETFLKAADEALFRAKAAGRDRVMLAGPPGPMPANADSG